MGWHGPTAGYRSVADAIADNFRSSEILRQAHDGKPGEGCGWVLIGGASTTDGEPLICCVLLRGGLVKLMDTTSGPYYYGCPVEWLDVAPVRHGCGGNDIRWRAEVRARAAGLPVRQVRVGSLVYDSAIVVPSGGVSCDD